MKHWNDLERQDLKEIENHQKNHYITFDQGAWDERQVENGPYGKVADEESRQQGNYSTL